MPSTSVLTRESGLPRAGRQFPARRGAVERLATAAAQMMMAGGHLRTPRLALGVLTRLGGGAFGNEDSWIDAALLRGLRLVEHRDLEVEMVSFGAPPAAMRDLLDAWELPDRA